MSANKPLTDFDVRLLRAIGHAAKGEHEKGAAIFRALAKEHGWKSWDDVTPHMRRLAAHPQVQAFLRSKRS